MSLEIEAKMKVPELEAVRARLETAGAERIGDFLETNVFFDTEDRSLLAADQGLRIRSARDGSGGEHFTITFKGPRQHGVLKSREEIELSIGDADAAGRIFQALGFSRVLSFEKKRQSWTMLNCRVELDELPKLGTFVEIEGPDEPSILKVRQTLHLTDRPLVKASYVALLMAYLQEHGNHLRSVTFANGAQNSHG